MTTEQKVTGFTKGTKKTKPAAEESHKNFGRRVAGVYVELTKRDAMIVALKMDAPSAEGLSNDDLVRLVVREVVLKQWSDLPGEIARCSNCKSFSHFELEECPFCGASDTDATDNVPTQKEVDDFHSACEAGVAREDAPAAKPAAKEEAPAEEKAMTTTTSAPTGAKQKTNGHHPDTPSMLAGGGISSTALAKATPAPMVVHTEEELDLSLRKYEELKSASFTSTWDLWHYVRVNIYENGLWKQRTNEKSEPGRYKTWQAFCHAELNVAPLTASNLMDVCRVVTRDEFLQWGSTKAHILVTAPKEEEARIRKMIASGASSRQLAEHAKEARSRESDDDKKARMKGSEKQKEARLKTGAAIGKKERTASDKPWTPKSKALKEAQKTPSGKITIANIIGVQEMVMYSQESVRAEAKGKGQKVQAKKLDQLPVGEIDLENGVKLLISWRNMASGFKTKVEFVRE